MVTQDAICAKAARSGSMWNVQGWGICVVRDGVGAGLQIGSEIDGAGENISRKGRQHRDLSTTLRSGRDDNSVGGRDSLFQERSAELQIPPRQAGTGRLRSG